MKPPKVEFVEITIPDKEIVTFLCSESWEYHSTPNPDSTLIHKNISEGYYNSSEVKSFFVKNESGVSIGFIRLFDLGDSTPLFDIRIAKSQRGKGFGESVLNTLIEYVFKNFKNISRIEGYTREDNHAMISLFRKCKFVKEAHHRKSWEQNTGEIFDSVGYCILKEDWLSGNTTPVNW